MPDTDGDFLGLFDELSDRGVDPDWPILQEFLESWEEEASQSEREAILRKYVAAHPHLEQRFLDHLSATLLLRRAAEPHPKSLGPFRVVRLLDSGGMGHIYEAEDPLLDRTVAVKTIRVGKAADSRLLDRFDREQKALARLHHTHIVPIYGAGEDDGLLYFAMPLIKGPSLADLVATMSRWPSPSLPTGPGSTPSGTTWDDILGKATTEAIWRRSLRRITATRASTTIPPDTRGALPGLDVPHPESEPTARSPLSLEYFRNVSEIIAVAAEALEIAHGVGVLHLDVKPANILLERSHDEKGRLKGPEHPWVIDFGLADRMSQEPPSKESSHSSASRNRETRVFGTHGFMTPEMLNRAVPDGDAPAPLDRRTDVWSLGVTLYQLLTLQMPFPNDSAILDPNRDPKPPGAIVRAFPRELEAVVLRALRKRPEDRYQTAGAFAEDLRRWREGYPTLAGQAGPWKRAGMWARRRPLAAFAAGMTTAFLIVSFLGAGQAIQFNRVQAEKFHAEADRFQAEARVAEHALEAKRRELELINVQRLRAPIRSMGWADEAWNKTRKLAAGRADEAGLYQGEFSALCEGLDARLVKTFAIDADSLFFDKEGKKLLMGQRLRDDQGRPMTVVEIGDVVGQSPLTRRQHESLGVLGFEAGSEARFLDRDPGDPTTLRLRDAVSGEVLRALKSPIAGRSGFEAHVISRDGKSAAAIARSTRDRTAEEMAEIEDKNARTTPVGELATLIVWDLVSGETRFTTEVKQPPTHDLVLSPDGSLLATWDVTGPGRDAVVWSVENQVKVGRFPSTRNAITSVAFGPDPTFQDDPKAPRWRLAIGEHGGMIAVWDLKSGAVRSLERGSLYDVFAFDFNSDGTLLASTGRSEARLWDVATGACQLVIRAGNYINALAFSADGQRLAVGNFPAHGQVGGVFVYELEHGRGLRTLRGLRQRVEKVAISADSRRIAVLTGDSELGVFDRNTGLSLGTTEAPESYFTDNAALVLNTDGTRLFCSTGHAARLWDVDRKRLIREWELSPGLSDAAAFRPDGRIFLIRQETEGGLEAPFGGSDPRRHPRVCRSFLLSEQGVREEVGEIGDLDVSIGEIVVSADASFFAVTGYGSKSGKEERIVRLYEGLSGKLIGPIATRPAPRTSSTMIRFDALGKRLSVQNFYPRSDAHFIYEVPSLKLAGQVNSPIVSVNRGVMRWVKLVAETLDSPTLILLNQEGKTEPLLRIVRDIESSNLSGCGLSPDGDTIIWGNRDGTVTVCDLNEIQRRLAGVGLDW